jgi:glycerol uptake facilitator protein
VATSGKPRGWRQRVPGELMSEALGTAIIILFGCGSVAMTVAALNQSDRGKLPFAASGDWLLITTGWGVGVALAVWVAGGVSGAHLNPAVTLAHALRRGFPWSKVPSYWTAQVFGAFVGAALIYLNYHDAISAVDAANKVTRGTPDSVATFSIFATFPAPYFSSPVGPLIDQIIGTGLLVLVIFAVIDAFNTPVKANLAPLVVGLIVVGIGVSFGANAGYAINPARDLGPRILAWIEGWKSVAIPGDYGKIDFYMWVPIVGPMIGGALGAYLYDYAVRDVLIARGAEPDPEIEEAAETAIDEPGGAAQT